jgi:hypothetical protein
VTSYIVPDTLASAEDYAKLPGVPPAPDDIDATLEACTDLVLAATATARYDVDPATGLAADAAIRGALTAATCLQAAAWVTLGIKPYAGAASSSGIKTSTKIGSASFEYAGAGAAAAARSAAATDLVPVAARRLQKHGLLGQRARVV